MTPEANERLIRRLTEEVWNHGNLTFLDGAYVAGHQPQRSDRLKRIVAALRSAFPDLQMRIVWMIVTGEDVAVHWTIQGTHRGLLQGISTADALSAEGSGEDHLVILCDVEPTGRRVAFDGVSFYHVEQGRIASSWVLVDQLAVLRQLGALPVPAATRPW